MAERKRKQNAKALIIETAIEVFAEFGYDGARVDEIAARADVAKALIYYHFKGKAELLMGVIDAFYEDFKAVILESIGNDEKIEKSVQEFVLQNEAVIRIILVESLKNNEAVPPVFKFIETMIAIEKSVVPEGREGDLQQRYMAEFFLNLIPRAMFTCFKADWGRYFSIEEPDLEKQFYSMMVDMHNSYLRRYF